MSKLSNFLMGIQVLEEKESPINGKITVIRDLAWGTHFQVSGITQSGGILKEIWKSVLKKFSTTYNLQPSTSLILGLGGGSLVKLIHNNYPTAKITGVDLDPVIIELGKKYLGLNRDQVQIQVQDALDFLTSTHKLQPKTYFDLICIDLYLGDHYPEKFDSEKFLRLVLKLLTSNGIAVFNHLYGENHKEEADIFKKKLKKVFPKVKVYYPEANIMFFCSK